MVDSFLGQAEEGNKTALLKLQLIGHYIMGGDFSITDLSHEMNLSVPTVTKLVSELIEEGFVHDFGKQGTAGGRRPNIYGLNPYAGYFVGVDIKKDIITLAIINSLQIFDVVFILTKGGPGTSTMVPAVYMYEQGFSYRRMGYCSALGTILFLLIMLLTVFNNKFLKNTETMD